MTANGYTWRDYYLNPDGEPDDDDTQLTLDKLATPPAPLWFWVEPDDTEQLIAAARDKYLLSGSWEARDLAGVDLSGAWVCGWVAN